MTKQQTVELLQKQLPGFYSVEQVIELINKIEEPAQSSASSTMTQDKYYDFMEAIESKLESRLSRLDTDDVVDTGSAEFELNGNEISLYSVDVNTSTIVDEVKEAVAVADELGLPYEIVDFDVRGFYLSGEAERLAVEIQCELLPFLVFFKVSQQLQAPTVLGGELLIEKYKNHNFKPEWVLRNIETLEASHVRFAQKFNIPFIIEWFSYTPELMLYYLEDPAIKYLVGDNTPYWSVTPVKNIILRRLVPELRIKEKTTGYENLKGLHVESRAKLASLMPDNIGDTHPYLGYNELIKRLRGQ